MLRSLAFGFITLAVPLSLAADADNQVEHAGLSHVGWQDRRPLCPLDGEAFSLRFQAYRFDLTAARVRVDVGGAITWVAASFLKDRGPYAIWEATVPATAADQLSYVIEVQDGGDIDYIGPDGPAETLPANGWLIDYQTLSHAPLGATPTSDGGCVFRVWAPSPASAVVRGSWNGWGSGTPMWRVGDDFIAYVANVPAGNRFTGANYKYVFNGNNWKPDPRARALNPGDNYNSVVVDPRSYEWGSDDYRTPLFEDLIIYQVHTGTFAGRNDPVGFAPDPSRYWDVALRADHLAELGVTAVMFNPFTEFPWDWSGGYNPITQFAPEAAYGHPDDVKRMVDALHERGIAVLLDVVWNHNSDSDNFQWLYDGGQIYFDTPPEQTPWGAQLDLDRPEVRGYFLDSIRYWLEEYRLDGFRFDATSFISQPQAGGWSLMQAANDLADQRFADRLLIAEQLPNDPWIVRPTSLGGAGFDSQYHLQHREALRSAIFDAAFGSPNMWAIHDALYATDSGMSPLQRLNYIELHDEAWPTSGGERLVRTIDPLAPHDSAYAVGRTTAAQGLNLLAPGIPAFLMGTEWLEDTNFGSNREPGNPDNRINWALKEAHRPIFDYYQDVIAVRKGNAALRANAAYDVYHVNDGADVLAMHRWDNDGNRIVVVLNMGNNAFDVYELGMPAGGAWYELINSQADGYELDGFTLDDRCNGGPIMADLPARQGFAQSVSIRVPAMSLSVLRHAAPPEPFLDGDQDLVTDACDNCPTVANLAQEDHNADGVGDACDCNDNGVRDEVELLAGTSTDADEDGIPDECQVGFARGDLNCDGLIDFFDIDPFVTALLDESGYAAVFPGCDAALADMNADGVVDFFDIDPFVATLLAGE